MSKTARGLLAPRGALQQGASRTREARADVTALSNDLSARIQGIGAQWGGEGARAFHRVHEAWQEKQRRIVSALDDFAASLVDTDKNNVTTDQLQADVADRLLSRIG